MSISINWQSQADKDIDAIEIYRVTGATGSINVNALPAPIATLSKEATSYVDVNVVDQNIYRYWIAAVKGTERTLNFPITQGFFLNMGPGPRELKRGTWQRGWFGKVSNEEMFTAADVRGLVAKLNMFSWNPDYWDKFIYNGKILFIPNKSMGYTTAIALYQAGIVYGVDGPGPYVPNGASSTNQLTKIRKGDFEFIVRLPRLLDSMGNVSTASYTGEVRCTMARMMEAKGTSYGNVIDGKMDYRPTTGGLSSTQREGTWCANIYSSTANLAYWDANNPEYNNAFSVSSNYPFIPVFELVQP